MNRCPCIIHLLVFQGGASTGYSLTAFVLIALVENSDSKVNIKRLISQEKPLYIIFF